jgi:hypothetical protein
MRSSSLPQKQEAGALSFNGTVEATQSGSGLGTELVANFCENLFSGLALTRLRSICSFRSRRCWVPTQRPGAVPIAEGWRADTPVGVDLCRG